MEFNDEELLEILSCLECAEGEGMENELTLELIKKIKGSDLNRTTNNRRAKRVCP
jgi:hypothetical protein